MPVILRLGQQGGTAVEVLDGFCQLIMKLFPIEK